MEWRKLSPVSAAPILGDQFASLKAQRWEATAEDGARVEVLRVGEGTAQAPHLLHVKVHAATPDGAARWPTLEEIQAAANLTVPAGTVVQIAPFPTYGADAAPVGAVGWAGVLVGCVGAMQGSPAERRFRLSGGIAVSPHAPQGAAGVAPGGPGGLS